MQLSESKLKILYGKEIKNYRLLPIEGDFFVHGDTLYYITAVSYMSGGVVTARRVDFTSGKHGEELEFSIGGIKSKYITASAAYDMIIRQLGMALRANKILTGDYPIGFSPSKSFSSKSFSRQYDQHGIRKPGSIGFEDDGRQLKSSYIDNSLMNPSDGLRIIDELPNTKK